MPRLRRQFRVCRRSRGERPRLVDGRREPAARFRVFGEEGSGGFYAYASNEDEFLALLACDVADLGMDDNEPSGSPDHQRYLAWLREQGLSPASHP